MPAPETFIIFEVQEMTKAETFIMYKRMEMPKAEALLTFRGNGDAKS